MLELIHQAEIYFRSIEREIKLDRCGARVRRARK
jgi:hypothetical protein